MHSTKILMHSTPKFECPEHRAAAMHGDPVGTGTTFKAFKYQGNPGLVNRVTSIGFENQNSFPRFLGGAFGEGDTVTAYLDLEVTMLPKWHTSAWSIH